LNGSPTARGISPLASRVGLWYLLAFLAQQDRTGRNRLPVNCLRRLWKFSQITFLKLDWVAKEIDPDERISRFVFREEYIKAGVKFAAFMPARDLVTSVYRTRHCSDRRIWMLGKFFVAGMMSEPKRLVGRVDIPAKQVSSAGLKAVPDPLTHCRHTEIMGWPGERAAQRIKAMALIADGAQAHTCPERYGEPPR